MTREEAGDSKRCCFQKQQGYQQMERHLISSCLYTADIFLCNFLFLFVRLLIVNSQLPRKRWNRRDGSLTPFVYFQRKKVRKSCNSEWRRNEHHRSDHSVMDQFPGLSLWRFLCCKQLCLSSPSQELHLQFLLLLAIFLFFPSFCPSILNNLLILW